MEKVGKSNILNRYIKDRFNEKMKPTIGTDFFSKILKINNLNIKV